MRRIESEKEERKSESRKKLLCGESTLISSGGVAVKEQIKKERNERDVSRIYDQ